MTGFEETAARKVPARFQAFWANVVGCSGRSWLRCLLLVVVGAAVRLPGLQGPFLWDDLYLARDNPFIKSPLLVPEAFRHYLFPDSFAGHYRPVQTVSYVLDYLSWNTDACGYHLSNLFWHIGSGILLYFLLQRLLKSVSGFSSNARADSTANDRQGATLSSAAFVVALLWVVHPVHSAAVDYISGRADSLAFFFACSGWLLYLRARGIEQKWVRWSCHVLATFSGLLSLCSRESGFIWMIAFFLYLFVFEQKPRLRGKFVVLMCCLTMAGIYGLLHSVPEYRPGHDVHPIPTAATKSVLILRALGDYGRLLVWPTNLHMERDVVNGASLQDTDHWRQTIGVEYLSMLGLVVAGVLVFGALRKGKAQRIRVLGAGWFLITFLPISNLFDLNATVAEHWMYLPSVGFLIFVAGCYLELPGLATKLAIPLTCVALFGLSARSFVRSGDWASEEMFYVRSLLAGGTSPRVCVNLAVIYSNRGEYSKAEHLLRKVLQADPTYVVARNNLGSLLARMGKSAEAEPMFASATHTTQEERATYPRTWAAALNLAYLAHARGDDREALAIVDQARCDYPGVWPLIRFETELLRKTQGSSSAKPIVEAFLRDHWWHCQAHIALGRLCWELGEVTIAENAFRRASSLDVHDAEALSALAVLQMQQNKLPDALNTQLRAVSRQPDSMQQYLVLSDLLKRMGRNTEADAAMAQAGKIKTMASALIAGGN